MGNAVDTAIASDKQFRVPRVEQRRVNEARGIFYCGVPWRPVNGRPLCRAEVHTGRDLTRDAQLSSALASR